MTRTLEQTVAENAARVGIQIPHTHCPYCNGHGWMPLAPHLLATWHALDPEKGQITAEVADKVRDSKEAVAHRLNQLCGLGLAEIVRMRPGDSSRHKPAAEWIRLSGEEVRPTPGQGQLFGATP